MREGGCFCGAVRYRIAGALLSSGVCHCRTCRGVASAPTLPFATLRIADFSLTRGTPVEFSSSLGVTRGFCGRCGSPLTYRSEADDGRMDVMTCSLDDPEAAAPTFHVWTSAKIGWDPLPDHLPAYPTTKNAEPAEPSGETGP